VNLIPMRAAVIAGTCAVALSFTALPAHADDAVPPSTSGTAQTTPAPAATDTTVDGGTVVTAPPSEGTPDPVATQAPAVTPTPLAAEKGTPKQRFTDTTLTPRSAAKHGVHAVYSGLTPGATYQPYYSSGRSGGELGVLRTATATGTIDFLYHFDSSEKAFTEVGARYAVGLLGLETKLRLTKQIAVKYDSDIRWQPAERDGKKVTLSAVVEKTGASGTEKAWKRAAVRFQKKVGSSWVTVKSDRTNADGLAIVTISSTVRVWRAVVDATSTVFGTPTKSHRK
jgi:hypothetical protein